jgi:hypothetical protein
MEGRPPKPKFPWWERQLADVERTMRDFLARRLPALSSQHDDFINDSLMALTQNARSQEGYPPAWYATEGEPDDAARSYFVRLAMTILRRRVADGFRGTARRWAKREDAALVDRVASGADADHAHLVTRMLVVCIEALDDASEEDRLLLAQSVGLVGETKSGDVPVGPRERQRLKRLRDRLAEAIRSKLGDDVAALLRNDE